MPSVGGMVRDKDGTPVSRVVRLYRRDTGALLGQTDSAGGPAIAGDDHYDSVSLLMHFDGADGSTTFIDSSKSPIVLTANGGANISTEHSLFGGSSGKFNGVSGSYVVVGAPNLIPALNIGSVDFSLEFAVRPTGSSTYAIIGNLHDQNGNGHFWVSINSTYLGLHTVQFGTMSGTLRFGSSALPSGTMSRVGIYRVGSTVKCFVDGVQLDTDKTLGSFSGNLSSTIKIGATYDDKNTLNGFIDELRITKGVARHSSNYTVPSSPYPETSITTPARALGEYVFSTTYSGEVQAVCLDDDAGDLQNDLILRTIPV